MLLALGRCLYDYRLAVIAVWLLLALLLKSAAPSWSHLARDGDLEHLPSTTTTARGAILSAEAFPNDRAQSQIVLVFVRGDQPLSVGRPTVCPGLGPAPGGIG